MVIMALLLDNNFEVMLMYLLSIFVWKALWCI